VGVSEKKRSVRGMAARWQTDLNRLEQLFGSFDADDYSPGAEMQRNLGTAIAHAHMFLNLAKIAETTQS
jgi:hypothetical protein